MAQPGSTAGGGRRISRRQFVKWTAAAAIGAGIAGVGGLSALGKLRGPEDVLPDWVVGPGKVDYSMLQGSEGKLMGPTPTTLKVAQWYEYWPGSFLLDFQQHMLDDYGLDVQVEWDVYDSNEELFNWITLGRRGYDIMVPTNYYSDLYKGAGMVFNMNPDWIPNLANLNWNLINRPRDDPWLRRGGPNGDLIAVPYFWGTTGVGYRTDVIDGDDMEAMGYDIFHKDSYTPSKGGPTVDLRKKMRMLDEMNDAFTAGFKEQGWQWQREQGFTPSGLLPEFGGQQWTSSETDPDRVELCAQWLLDAKPRLFSFNSTEAYTSLMNFTAYANQDWNGDILYAKAPQTNNQYPVDYVVPIQGSTIWFDSICLHNRCRNVWLAHEFINFIHDLDQNRRLTIWNMYSTPNKACFDSIKPFPNGYSFTADPRAYPDVNDPDVLKRCDLSRYNDLNVLLNIYNPHWAKVTGA